MLRRNETNSNAWNYDLIIINPSSFVLGSKEKWQARVGEIGEYVVWHHFGGANSENVKSQAINDKWAGWKGCLDSNNLLKVGDTPCFFPFSMNSGCMRPWDRACQELCDVVRGDSIVDASRLKRALKSLDEAVAPAIRHFFGRPADLLEHLFPVMIAIQGGLPAEVAKKFLPQDDALRKKAQESLKRWQEKRYWDGISFLVPPVESVRLISDAAHFSNDFMDFFEESPPMEEYVLKELCARFASVCKLIREVERPG